jgi:hypothetical protein
MRRSVAFLATTLLLCLGSPAAGTRTVLAPIRDSTLYESVLGEVASGAGPALFTGTNGNFERRRALLLFDVAAIPSGVRVDSVSLVIQVTRTRDPVAREFSLHRVLADWGEGTSNAGGDSTAPGGGAGVAATIGDATWSYGVFDAERWAHAGGDFDAAVLATTDLGEIGAATWRSTPALVASFQAWVDGTAANFGWMVRGEEVRASTARRFGSRQSTNANERPFLVVDYTPTAVHSLTWAAIKAVYRDANR